jgi:hypothetical protein
MVPVISIAPRLLFAPSLIHFIPVTGIDKMTGHPRSFFVAKHPDPARSRPPAPTNSRSTFPAQVHQLQVGKLLNKDATR